MVENLGSPVSEQVRVQLASQTMAFDSEMGILENDKAWLNQSPRLTCGVSAGQHGLTKCRVLRCPIAPPGGEVTPRWLRGKQGAIGIDESEICLSWPLCESEEDPSSRELSQEVVVLRELRNDRPSTFRRHQDVRQHGERQEIRAPVLRRTCSGRRKVQDRG
jgi:hypothetical protein